MYQIFGAKWLATLCGGLIGIVATVYMAIQWAVRPTAPWGWAEYLWNPVATGITVATVVLAILGQSRLFPLICRHRLICGFMPDLDGKWTGEISSNWSRIKARGDGVPQTEVDQLPLLIKAGKLQIKARLLKITLKLDMDDQYSNSTTVLVGISKHPETDEVTLGYIYENKTRNPKPGDEPFHYGAGWLTLNNDENQISLKGHYWTNRAWTHGINTAGLANFEKVRN